MGESWGHTLERLSADRLAELERTAARLRLRGRQYKSCTVGRMDHLQPATYVATYNYVTGRAGRVSWASKRLCDDHAAKFAAKHGIDLAAVPVQDERPKHALERLLDAAAPPEVLDSRPWTALDGNHDPAPTVPATIPEGRQP